MANNSLNISIPIKFEIKAAPRGMTDYDPKALSSEQQRELNLYKLDIRKENIMYLKDHPEVKALVSMVTRKTITQKPLNIIEYIAKLFTRPEEEIRRDVNAILKESELEHEIVPHEEYEIWDY